MFRHRMTDEEVIEKGRKSLIWLNKWGRWPSLAFCVLVTAASIGFAVLIVKVGFRILAPPQPGQNQGFLFGMAVGGMSGLVAGWLVMQGFEFFNKGLDLFFHGERQTKILITYHDTLDFMLKNENYILRDLESASEDVRRLLEKRLVEN